MLSTTSRRQRIAIFDPELRSREHMRRAIRATGHTPYVFASIEEMQQVDPAQRPFAMAYVGCTWEEDEIEEPVREVRACLGDTVPLLLAVKPKLVRSTAQDPAIAATHVMPLQPRFSDMYRELTDFMWAHAPHPQQALLRWGEFRFRPAVGTVQVGGAQPMRLPVLEFELALELFHNMGRGLSRSWLNAMLAPPSRAISAAAFQDAVDRLRQLLSLQVPAGWQIQLLKNGSFQLDATTPDADDCPESRAERQEPTGARAMPAFEHAGPTGA